MIHTAMLYDWCVCMDNDQDDRVKYQAETGRGKMEKEALLNDSDSLWAEFRHAHIAKVLNDLGERSDPVC